MYCCNGVVVAVNATMTNDHYAKYRKSNSILIRKIKTYPVTVTSSQSQRANVILQCQCDILYTDLINNSLSNVSSAIAYDIFVQSEFVPLY